MAPNTSNNRGAFSATATPVYAVTDVVSYDSQEWVCNVAGTTVTPGSDGGIAWTVFADERTSTQYAKDTNTDAPQADVTTQVAHVAAGSTTAANLGHMYICDGAATIDLPAASQGGRVSVVNVVSTASTSVLPPAGGATLNGVTTAYTLTGTAYQRKDFVGDAAGNWVAV